jgi:hypothetical protein
MDVETNKPVSWGSVIGGVFMALLSGVVVVPVAMLAGAFLGSLVGRGVAVGIGLVLALAIAGAIYYLLWRLTRRKNPDLATGLIIGGALITLLSGACGAMMSSVMSGGMH